MSEGGPEVRDGPGSSWAEVGSEKHDGPGASWSGAPKILELLQQSKAH